MIDLLLLRELTLRAPSAAQRQPFLSAASGLVQAGEYLYVVADDENHLAVFTAASTEPGHLVRLFPGDLPHADAQRKPAKPDLEALLYLPRFGTFFHGALLAVPSGSKPNRRSGALLALDETGAIADPPRPVDFSGLFGGIAETFPKLNIEGAVISGEHLVLLHRGNKRNSRNACIYYDFADILAALAGNDTLGESAPLAVQWFELGHIDGIPLCFTDAAALPGGGFVFTAVAENTADNYEDGSCAGAAIGHIDVDGKLLSMRRVPLGHKVEGIAASRVDGQLRLLLVTDADDASVPARLLSAELRDWL